MRIAIRFIALVFCLMPSLLLMSSATTQNYADPGQKGPYEVGFTFFQVTDETRNTAVGGRPIAVYLFYPVDPDSITQSTDKAIYPLDPFFGILPSTTSDQWESYGLEPAYQEPTVAASKPFPLIMFSPGWTQPAFSNMSIPLRAASHGFVVALLTHYGDGALPWDDWDHMGFALMNRPLDVSFALDAVLQRSQTSGDLLEGSIDSQKIAAAGHSLGGYAAFALAGGVDSVCTNAALDLWPDGPLPQLWLPVPSETCVELAPDRRIRAIVPIDGSNQEMHFYELSRITVPYIGIGEEWTVLIGQIGAGFEYWHAREHAAIQSTPSYRVDVNGAHHITFSDACETGYIFRDIEMISNDDLETWWQAVYCSAPLTPTETRRLAAKYMIAFLKTHLVGDQGYQSILTPGYALTHEQNIEFFVTEKRNAQVINVESNFFNYFQHQPGSAQARAEKDAKQRPTFRPLRKWN